MLMSTACLVKSVPNPGPIFIIDVLLILQLTHVTHILAVFSVTPIAVAFTFIIFIVLGLAAEVAKGLTAQAPAKSLAINQETAVLGR